MKVLLVTDYYPPISGGVARHVFLLANALHRRGHKITVFAYGPKEISGKTNENGITIFRSDGFFQRLPFLFTDSNIRHHPPTQDFRVVKALKDLIRSENPDIVHSHGWILNSITPLKKSCDITLIHTLHDHGLFCPNKTYTQKSIVCTSDNMNCVRCSMKSFGVIKAFPSLLGVRRGLRKLDRVDKFIAVSDYMKRVHLCNLPLTRKDIVVIPNFYRKEDIGSVSTKNLPESFILFVGALSPVKGIDVLMDAYRRVKQPNKATKLVIVGMEVSPYNYNSMGNILVLRNARRDILLQAYSRAKFLVIPSIWPEAFGQVALEGMAFRKAVIASKIGGLTEIVQNNETGLLVEPNSSITLARAMESLLEDDKKTIDMGIRGYNRFVEYFSEEKILPSIERVYRETAKTSVSV